MNRHEFWVVSSPSPRHSETYPIRVNRPPQVISLTVSTSATPTHMDCTEWRESLLQSNVQMSVMMWLIFPTIATWKLLYASVKELKALVIYINIILSSILYSIYPHIPVQVYWGWSLSQHALGGRRGDILDITPIHGRSKGSNIFQKGLWTSKRFILHWMSI